MNIHVISVCSLLFFFFNFLKYHKIKATNYSLKKQNHDLEKCLDFSKQLETLQGIQQISCIVRQCLTGGDSDISVTVSYSGRQEVEKDLQDVQGLYTGAHGE